MNQTFQNKPYLAGLLIAVTIFILDQWIKYEVVYNVMARPHVIEVTSFFNIVMAWNRGVSFGMFSGDAEIQIYILAGIAFIAAIGLFIWMVKEGRLKFAIPCGAIIGGALGNGLDRLHWGAVADYLDFHVMGYHWPAFNLADIGVCCGAVLLILDSLFIDQDSSKTEGND